MAEIYRYSYAGLDTEGTLVKGGSLFPHKHAPAKPLVSKLDPSKAEMISTVPVAISVDETIALAAIGGRIGTELPPDQVP